MLKISFSIFSFSCFLVIFFYSCQNSENNSESNTNFSGMDLRTKQYMVAGQKLYKIHCSNCHMDDGKGLARLIPPLAGSDYMISDISRTICLIRHGLSGEIKVNDQFYNHPMPGNQALTYLEIAEITTYILNSWGYKEGIVNINQVKEALQSCH